MVGPIGRKAGIQIATMAAKAGAMMGARIVTRITLPLASAISTKFSSLARGSESTHQPLNAHERVAILPTLPAAERTDTAARSVLSIGKAALQSIANSKATASEFRVVNTIASRLREKGCAVVYGAPGTGKTEQMELACTNPPKTFDLKQEYYNHLLDMAIKKAETAKGSPLSADERKDLDKELWGKYDKKYTTEEGKSEELKWLKENYTTIRDQLIDQDKPIVNLDEIDLVRGELEGPSLESALLIIDLAKEVRDSGKQVLITLHRVGVENLELVDRMKQSGLIDAPGEIIKTQLLSQKEQLAACKSMGFSDEDAKKIVDYTRGVPGAFLEFMKKASKNQEYSPTYIEFISASTEKLGKNIVAIQKSSSETAKKILEILVQNDNLTDVNFKKIIEKTGEDAEAIKRELLDTGLIYTDGTTLVMPEAVRLAYQGLEYTESLRNIKAFTSIPSSDSSVTLATTELKTHGSIYEMTEDFIARRLGGGRILITGTDIPKILIPNNINLLCMKHYDLRMSISADLEIQNRLPEERRQLEHVDWTNSAKSVDELLTDAGKAKDPFLDVIRTSTGSLGLIHTGDDNKFLIKTKDSVERKLKSWSNRGVIEEKNLKAVNDTIRATVIIDDVEGKRAIIDRFYDTAVKNGWKVVFSDKYDNIYFSGYVGVHAKVLIPIEGGRHVMGEVQFHLTEIHDGSESSVKEASHELLDTILRPLADDNKKGTITKQLSDTWGIDPALLETDIGLMRIIKPALDAGSKAMYTTALTQVKR